MKPEEYKDFYTKESGDYHSNRYGGIYGKLFQQLHHEALKGLLCRTPNDHLVLEVACGTGHTSELLSDLHIKTISCDLTSAMMDQARLRTAGKKDRPDFLQANAMDLPFPDSYFDKLVSTRFLHLFRYDVQQAIIEEMHRVLKPGGEIILDFDSWSSRWIFSVPYLIYNVVRYRRFSPFSIYNRIGYTREMMSNIGFDVRDVHGVGGTHLSPLALLNFDVALKAGRAHAKNPLRIFAEQFIVYGLKK